MTAKTWILYATDPEQGEEECDACVLETFDRPPSRGYAVGAYGGGFLYEYDLVNGEAVNSKLAWYAGPKKKGKK